MPKAKPKTRAQVLVERDRAHRRLDRAITDCLGAIQNALVEHRKGADVTNLHQAQLSLTAAVSENAKLSVLQMVLADSEEET
jgi:hypothetical protein